MKINLIILIVFVLFTNNICSQVCELRKTLANVGGNCTSASIYCVNSTCIAGTCSVFKAFDGSCTDDIECAPSLTCNNGVCNGYRYAINSNDCSVNQDCYTESLLCNAENICKFNTTIGCETSYDCNLNNVCTDGACVPSQAVNGPCTSRFDCNQGLVCSYKDNSATSTTCQSPWSKKPGDKCNSSPDDNRIPFYVDCDIGSDLICQNSKCIKTVQMECKSCTGHSDCSNFGEACLCDGTGKGTCQPQVFLNNNCKTVFKSLMECAINNDCLMTQNLLFNQESCIQKNCNSLTCGMSSCFSDSNSVNYALAVCSNYSQPSYALKTNICSSIAQPILTVEPSSSSILLPSILLIFISIINLIF